MKRHVLLVITAAILLIIFNDKFQLIDAVKHHDSASTPIASNELIASFNNKQSNNIVTASGTVIKLLADDNVGNRHQKFIVRISSSLSVLIAHNIDLAPRVDALQKGDPIEFKGEYEWNKKGGVVHWTHHDPKGYHPGGWIKYRDKIYQ